MVAPGGDDGRGEAELGVRAVDADDPGQVLAGAVVDVEAGAVGDLGELLERHVEPVAGRVGAPRDQGVPAAELGALDPGERHRDALARLGPLHRPVVHLDAPHADVDPGRLGPQLVALADRAGPERPGRDRADPLEREDPVDEEAGRPRRRPLLDRGRRRRPARRAARRAPRPCGRSWPRRPRPGRARGPPSARAPASPRPPRRPSSPPRRRARSRAAAEWPGARASAAARPRRRRRRAGRGRSRSRRRPWCGRSARGPARPRARGASRPAAPAARSRGRWRCRAPAPPAAGRCPSRSAR